MSLWQTYLSYIPVAIACWAVLFIPIIYMKAWTECISNGVWDSKGIHPVVQWTVVPVLCIILLSVFFGVLWPIMLPWFVIGQIVKFIKWCIEGNKGVPM